MSARICKMASSTAHKCCLCCEDVSGGTMKAKRIKALGSAAKVTVNVLDGLAVRFFNKFTVGTSVNQTTFFRHNCRAKAETLTALLEKVQSAEKELLVAMTTAFHSSQGRSEQRKRGLSEPVVACNPSEKVIRQDESIMQQSATQEEPDNSYVVCEETQASSVSVSVVCCKVKYPLFLK